jgi:uncharacterized membrane-anchored protein
MGREGAMRRLRGVMAAALATLVGVAHALPTEEEQRKVWEDVGQAARKGPVDVALIDQAVLHVPSGEVFVPQPQADRLLNMWGNPGKDADMQGVILPRDPKASWFMPVRFQASGYIKDDDAKKWDADDMLKSFRDGTEEQNKEREKMGSPGLEVIGWSEPPRYDATKRRLVWAMSSREIGAKADEPQNVNYNTYALGRDGYFSLNMVTTLAELPALKPVAEEQLAALDFNAGKHYADFDEKTDHVAEYGLAALVVGVAAHKLGFIALLLAFAAKFAKVIFIALAVFGGGVMKFFKRNPTATAALPAEAALPAAPAFVNTVTEAPVSAVAASAGVDLDPGEPSTAQRTPGTV